MNNKIEILAAEVLERAVRITLLVRLSTRRISVSFQKDTAQLAAAKQIQHLLEELIIEPLMEIFSKIEKDELSLDRVKGLLETVAAIHEGALPTVPRVIEPIELRSYLRQSGNIEQDKPPLVFASERLGTQVYPNSLAGLLLRIGKRQNLIAQGKHSLEKLKELAQFSLNGNSYKAICDHNQHAYVAIPAVDVHNPNRWPSLWHELAHHELKKKLDTLIVDFERHINGGNSTSNEFRILCLEIAPLAAEDCADEQVQFEVGKNLIENWLAECWCDAYGVRQAGLAFLYSQLHDFMFCFESYLAQPFRPGRRYPPAGFRLDLARNFALERLRHRAINTHSKLIDDVVNDYEKEEKIFKDIACTRDDYGQYGGCVSLLFNHFLVFLKRNIAFDSDSTLGGDISAEVFQVLEADLKQGFPIPYVSTVSPAGSRATRVSEIILAGWRNRNVVLRNGIIQALKTTIQGVPEEKQVQALTQNVGILIDRADESVKRSIQVAEWFSILHDAGNKNVDIHIAEPILKFDRDLHLSSTEDENSTKLVDQSTPEVVLTDIPIGLLSDNDINALLSKDRPDEDRMRVIPLIDKGQVSGSAIDLRLGHNFEVFQPLFESAIDACDNEVDGRQDSLQVEIDFLHGLPLLPGQFVLGHTLEYIKLPKNVAAQIEGRSSYARLGIQVHMTANLVEVGFDGCLTLEIHNNGPATVVLYPGMRIAQLRIYRLETTPSKQYGRPGNKYRGQLSHNKTKHTDPEVAVFREERAKRRIV